MTGPQVPLREYFEALRSADQEALRVARAIQEYKDEKANELREQIYTERGRYATKDDLVNAVGRIEQMIKPLADYVSGERGRTVGMNALWGYLVGAVAVAAALVAIFVK